MDTRTCALLPSFGTELRDTFTGFFGDQVVSSTAEQSSSNIIDFVFIYNTGARTSAVNDDDESVSQSVRARW